MGEYYMVDVRSITSKASRSQFDVKKLEELARSIVSSEGLLYPLLLKQTGAESYEVIAGDFEYYAAVRARELFPREAEMVNAFVVPDKMTKDAVKQFELLHSSSTQQSAPKFFSKQSSGGKGQIANLEDRLDEFMRDFKQMRQQDMKSIEEGIETLREQLPSQVEALEALNEDSIPDLMQKLAKANVKGKTAEKIIKSVEKERKKQAFSSFRDVVDRVNGLGTQGMLTLLDKWGGMY